MDTSSTPQPPQHQSHQPGRQDQMRPAPIGEGRDYKPSGKLNGKVALITGGDSGIGRATAVACAKEGADIAILYLEEEKDAKKTEDLILTEGQRCLRIRGDISNEAICKKSIEKIIAEFGKLNILINNAAVQFPQDDPASITSDQIYKTFSTNVFGMMYLTFAALPHLPENSTIINTSSVTAYRGSKHLIDYAASKGAIIAFTRSLALALVERKIRVNAVAPGPVWTPLISATFDADEVAKFGTQTPMKRAGQPDEISPCYIFLASEDSSYMTGQVLHPNGGEIINS